MRIGVGDKLVSEAKLPCDTEAARLCIELPDKLDDKAHDLFICPVGPRNGVSGGFVSRLLKRRDRGAGRNTARGASLRHISGARRFLELVDLHLLDVKNAGRTLRRLDPLQPLLGDVPFYLDHLFAPVKEIIDVDARSAFRKIPDIRGIEYRIEHRGVELVDIHLRVPPDIDNPEPVRRALLGIQNVKHNGIHPMVVKAHVPQRRIVFRGIEDRAAAEFAVMQNRFSARRSGLVIPVDDDGLVAVVDAVVVLIIRNIDHVPHPETGIGGLHRVTVGKGYDKQMLGILNIGNPRLPKDIE